MARSERNGQHDEMSRAMHSRRVVALLSCGALALAALAGVSTGASAARSAPSVAASTTPISGPVGPLTHVGRWLVDQTGRVVTLHGANEVAKEAPYYPASIGFDDDDAAFLAARGFGAVRLGVVWSGLEPTPGHISQSYITHIVDTVHVLAAHHIFVLLDFHQDGWGPVTHGNGAPAWATITDGLPNPNVPFPLYYIGNPALQRAFENFWKNRPASDGVGLQDHYVAAARAVAAAVANEPYLLGYDPMNEPWPGANWQPCTTGCPAQEAASLTPFYRRFTTAIRSVDPRHLVMPEPFVLFNFGEETTSLPAIGAPGNGLSYHVYATTPQDNFGVMQHAVAAAQRNGDALLASEWGAITDPVAIRQTADQFDLKQLSWLFWSYNDEMVLDSTKPPTGANVDALVMFALARPYPLLTDGVPRSFTYHQSTHVFDDTFSTRRLDGRVDTTGVSVISIPPGAYPHGYTVVVHGARVVSSSPATEVELQNLPGAANVSITLTPKP
jgi:endoglycosylceramidase